MIDIHTHVIYGVDDGSPSIKESMKMVLEAENQGIKALIATPHFHNNAYQKEKVAENFMELVQRVEGCGVSLHLGYEVMVNRELSKLVRNNKMLSLNGSKYLLIELPFDIIPPYSYYTIYNLHLENIVPIIAHPERNRQCVNNFNTFMELVEKGCLLQLDAASIIGVYGTNVKKFTKKLIQLNLAHFVASDAHSSDDYTNWYLQAKKQVLKWAGKEYTEKLFNQSPKIILE